VIIIVAMVPSGSRRRFAAGGSEMTLKALLVQIVAIRTAVQGGIAMKQQTLFIQPCLPENMIGAFPMAVVTIRRRIAKRPVQVMALVAGAGKICIVLVRIIVTMVPSGPRRRFTAGGPEMAFKAFLVQIVAIRAVVQVYIAMKLRIVPVQPCLPEHMIDALSMAVMAHIGPGAELPPNRVAGIANVQVDF
jgi:hypothetical protein